MYFEPFPGQIARNNDNLIFPALILIEFGWYIHSKSFVIAENSVLNEIGNFQIWKRFCLSLNALKRALNSWSRIFQRVPRSTDSGKRRALGCRSRFAGDRWGFYGHFYFEIAKNYPKNVFFKNLHRGDPMRNLFQKFNFRRTLAHCAVGQFTAIASVTGVSYVVISRHAFSLVFARVSLSRVSAWAGKLVFAVNSKEWKLAVTREVISRSSFACA